MRYGIKNVPVAQLDRASAFYTGSKAQKRVKAPTATEVARLRRNVRRCHLAGSPRTIHWIAELAKAVILRGEARR